MSSTVPLPGVAGKRGRPITASSSLGTLRARIAELQRIVAHPELYLAGLSPEARIAQVAAHQAQIQRFRDMEAAKASAINPSRAATNERRAAAAEPHRILTALRSEVLAVIDDARARARQGSLQGELPTDVATTTPMFTRLHGVLRDSYDELSRRYLANYVLEHGDPASDEDTAGLDSESGT